MGERADTLPGFESIEPVQPDKPLAARPEGRLVQVQPDITAITQSFTYEVPVEWESDGRAEKVDVGSLVRVDFAGRRTAGWVTEVDVGHDPTMEIAPLRKWSSVGPSAEIVELAQWAAHRWYGRPVHFLRAASPSKMVSAIPDKSTARSGPEATSDDGYGSLFEHDGITLVETAPADRGVAIAAAAATRGNALVLAPTIADRRHIAAGLKDVGVHIAEYPEQWSRAASGTVVVGTRLAAFASLPEISSVVVVDEHDAAYKEERTPAWNARDVVIERSRRLGVPCILTSPSPSLEALVVAERRLTPERSAQRNGWPHVQVVDMRRSETPGLLSVELVDAVRADGPVACILNRKGRAQMLACSRCDSLADCEQCGAAVHQPEDVLICRSCGTERPVVCSNCGTTKMKLIRPGISRVAEELAALAKRPVVEVTAETEEKELISDDLFIGTEALLYRIESATSVVFLDFDQELAQPRSRAPENAFSLLALAARRVGDSRAGGRVIVQTRRPDDVVVQAAVHADPSRVAEAQRDVRQLLHQPPYGAWALVSGAGAEAFIESLRATTETLNDGVELRAMGDRWRVSATDHQMLLDALHRAERPAERLRVEVDPIDI